MIPLEKPEISFNYFIVIIIIFYFSYGFASLTAHFGVNENLLLLIPKPQ